MATYINKTRTKEENLVFAVDGANARTTAAEDLTSNGNNGTLNGAVLKSGVWEFDGVSDWIDFGSVGFLDNLTTWTVDIWFKANTLHDGILYVERDFVGVGTVSCQIRTRAGGTFQFAIRTDAGVNETDLNIGSYSANEWTNITMVRNGNDVFAYKNTLQIGTDTQTYGSLTMVGSNVYVGKIETDGGTLFEYNGIISSVKVYNTALTAQEVLDNYNASKRRFQGEITDGLRLHFNSRVPGGVVGTSWTELSGEGSNGSLVSMGSDYRSGFDGRDITNDAASDDLRLGNTALVQSLFTSTNDWSINVWYKPLQNGGEPISLDSGQPDSVFVRHDGTNQYRVKVDAIGQINFITTTANRRVGEWINLCLTYDGGPKTLRFYEDGVLIQSGTNGSMTGNFWVVGELRLNAISNIFNPYNAKNGSAKVYARTLTAAEITQEYNATKHYWEDEDKHIVLDGLVGHWNSRAKYGGVDGTDWFDRAGVNDGAIIGSPTVTAEGDLDFNGSSQYVDCGLPSTLDFMSGGSGAVFSISAWINPDVYPGTFSSIIARQGDNANDPEGWFLQLRPGGILAISYVKDLGANNWKGMRTNTSIVPLNTWTNIVVTCDGTNGDASFRFFIDGEETDYNPWSLGTYDGTALSTTDKMFIAARDRLVPADAYFDGKISNVLIYNRELTAGEIKSNYSATKQQFI